MELFIWFSDKTELQNFSDNFEFLFYLLFSHLKRDEINKNIVLKSFFHVLSYWSESLLV